MALQDGEAEQISNSPAGAPLPCPYQEPAWATDPPGRFFVEVLKAGTVADSIPLDNKRYFVIGRLASCDIALEHASISRYHAVLQHRENNHWYIFDLKSTHGSTLNKTLLKPHAFFRVRPGDVLRFGASSRLFVLRGPPQEEEEQLNEREQQDAETSASVVAVNKRSDDGVSWGMHEDDIPANDARKDVYRPVDMVDVEQAHDGKEPFYMKNPRKILQDFFDREGVELVVEISEKQSQDKGYLAKISLPLDLEFGGDICARGSASRKKEAERFAIVDACRLLDKHGVLRESHQYDSVESSRQKRREENEYYDSDEDSFLDRTGELEKKRLNRMIRAGKSGTANADDIKQASGTVMTYESLLSEKARLENELSELDGTLASLKEKNKDARVALPASTDDADSLDQFMKDVMKPVAVTNQTTLQQRQKSLLEQLKRTDKLIAIAKPAGIAFESWKTADTQHPRVQQLEETSPAISDAKPLVNAAQSSSRSFSHRSEELPSRGSANDFVPVSWAIAKGQQKKFDVVEEDENEHEVDKTATPSVEKRKNIARRPLQNDDFHEPKPHVDKKPRTHPARAGVNSQDVDESAKYSEWLPPTDQKGDGRTSLNDRLGY